nr:conserved exported protein of unknown function [Candidatus Magnetococcus massalia]
MSKHSKTWIDRTILIIIGGVLIMSFTLYGILTVGDIIEKDAQFGPILAAATILLPIFIVLGIVYYLAHIKKCEACGKIIWWKREGSEDGECKN